MNTPPESKKNTRARRAALAAATLAATFFLSGCSTPTPDDEPYFDQLTSTALDEAGFTREGEPLTSCGGNIPFCTSPVFTVQYIAPSSMTPEQACAAFTTTAFSVSHPAMYASTGYTAGPLPLLAEEITVDNFCIEGLGTPMPGLDGATVFYQGTTVMDMGIADQIAKEFSIGREGDGNQAYRVTINFSRNLDTMWWQSEKTHPAHRTLEQVLQANEEMKTQSVTQDFANSLIGKNEKAASAAIRKAGYTSHVFQRDDQEHPTKDMNPKRILLNVQDGVVLDAVAG